jgi:outer membrane protein OmpA-like peptidoglycan-associated protein
MPSRRRLSLALIAAAAAASALLGLAASQGMPGGPQTGAAAAPIRGVVFFTEDSAALNPEGGSIIRSAADAAKADPNARVTVLGFAGPAGSAGFNQALSDARARNVADRLVEYGVPRSRIAIRPRGPVPFEMMPTESRRVEILIGG